MAELYARMETRKVGPAEGSVGAVAPEVVPQPPGPGPLWRSLLFPQPGQSALALGEGAPELFGSLSEAGVRIVRDLSEKPDGGGPPFDLVVEDRANRNSFRRPRSVNSLLTPEGRWVVVVQRGRWVGLAGRAILRQARREGLDRVETFYAHPSVRSPQILVPLERPEPFLYFLRLAVGVRATRQRMMVLGIRLLWRLRLHRELLPNLIVVARRLP